MRLPNGYGSVYKVKGRRNPWRAVASAPERRHIGYFATRKEAVKALADIAEAGSNATVGDVYERWSAEKYPTLSTYRHYERAFDALTPISNKPISSLKLDDLEKVLDGDMTDSAKVTVKLLLNQIYEYAMKHDIVQKNYSTYLSVKTPKTKRVKKPFTKDEIQLLFDDGTEIARMVLVSIYSGWRPSELISYTIEGDLMRGGVKTEAGKNRIVPIHPKIQPFVREYRTTYNVYHKQFNILMERLDMTHSPHECRHTFITMAKEQGVNDDIIKLLVGHARADLTESVYTHRTMESLRRAVARIDWE